MFSCNYKVPYFCASCCCLFIIGYDDIWFPKCPYLRFLYYKVRHVLFETCFIPYPIPCKHAPFSYYFSFWVKFQMLSYYTASVWRCIYYYTEKLTAYKRVVHLPLPPWKLILIVITKWKLFQFTNANIYSFYEYIAILKVCMEYVRRRFQTLKT